MRITRMLALAALTMLALAAEPVLAPTRAFAGNWAVTLLDPLPERIESGRGYTVGLWVLQHGTHPFQGDDLGEVGLRLVGGKGTSVTFPGFALAEPAHFAAAVVVPHAGEWAVIGVQGVFSEYRIGTLTVPGRLTVLGVPVALDAVERDRFWPGAIRPPAVPVDTGRSPFGPLTTVDLDRRSASPTPVADAASTPTETPGLFLVAAFVIAVLTVALVVGRRRRPR